MPHAIDSEIDRATIEQLAVWFRDARLTPLALVEHYLQRIEQLEPRLHAWVIVDKDGARQQAEQFARELGRGFDRGPLHGIPIGVKDIVDVAGLPTRCGSPLTDPNPAKADAPVVARLRNAGAIIIGKTITCEWACFDPPATRNPWNASRTPGGSSSGSAVAVASGMCCAALGTQTGGSITRPAAYCGVVGWKPARGTIPLTGVASVSFNLDHVGVLARQVVDAQLIAEQLSASPGLTRPAARNRWRIARPSSYFFIDEPSKAMALIEAAIESTTAEIVLQTVALPASFSQVHEMHRRIMAFDCAQVHRKQFSTHRAEFGPNVAGLIEEGLAVRRSDYEQALAHQQQFTGDMAEFVQCYDALLTPATPSTAPNCETTGDPRFNSPWSYCGLPTVSIPVGLQQGLPEAVQLIGCDEPKLFQLARALEQPLLLPPPAFPN